MAIICAFMFPDKFIITGFIFFSIIFLIVGIYCYEKKTINVPTNFFQSEPIEKLQKISIEQPNNNLWMTFPIKQHINDFFHYFPLLANYYLCVCAVDMYFF